MSHIRREIVSMAVIIMIVIIALIAGCRYHQVNPKVPLINNDQASITNEALLHLGMRQMLQIHSQRRFSQLVEEHKERQRRYIVDRYGALPCQLVIASDDRYRLILDYPSMNYRLVPR